jgi:hypothetical protein
MSKGAAETVIPVGPQSGQYWVENTAVENSQRDANWMMDESVRPRHPESREIPGFKSPGSC